MQLNPTGLKEPRSNTISRNGVHPRKHVSAHGEATWAPARTSGIRIGSVPSAVLATAVTTMSL